jgi:hypothetical protein
MIATGDRDVCRRLIVVFPADRELLGIDFALPGESECGLGKAQIR